MALIIAETPKITTKTFAHWWLFRILGNTEAPSTPQQRFGMSFQFIRGNRNEDGTWELSPFAKDVRNMNIVDVYDFAAEEASKGNNQPAQIIESLLTLAGSIAKQNGVID